MISIKEINKETVKCIPKQKIEAEQIRGYEQFPEPYSNIFLIAKKNSGKSTVVFNILKKCIGRDTRVVIFSPTAYKDSNWAHIRKFLKKKKVDFEVHQSIIDESGNILKNIIDELQVRGDDPDDSDEEPEEKFTFIKVDDNGDEEEPKRRKEKKVAPEIIFVFDDLSSELRTPVIASLLKKNRHFKSKVIMSSQWLNDLQPASVKNLDYMLIFQGLPEEKLKRVHQLFDVSITFEKFQKIYKHATKEKYQFLWVSSEGCYRKNFNKMYKISDA